MADMWTTIATERGALAEDLDRAHRRAVGHALAVRGVERRGRGRPHDLDRTDDSARSSSPASWSPASTSPSSPRTASRPTSVTTPLGTWRSWRKQQHSKKSPPGPKVTWLGETLIHSEDIRRPLGIDHDYPLDAVTQVLDFYKNSDTLIRAKSRIAGLTLQATDTDWTHGTGPLVEGRLSTADGRDRTQGRARRPHRRRRRGLPPALDEPGLRSGRGGAPSPGGSGGTPPGRPRREPPRASSGIPRSRGAPSHRGTPAAA